MRREKLLKTIELERLLDLKVDFAFKQLFGSEKNKSITIVFLNAILQKTNRGTIKSIQFKNIELVAKHRQDKEARLDILAYTDKNEYINIEIQFTNKYDMINRSIYYWSEVYLAPFEKGMFYKTLKPVIAINIMNFNLFKEAKHYHTAYHLYEDEEQFKLTDMMEFHFIEMPKLIRDWQNGVLAPWDDVLARWLLLLGMVDHRKEKVYEEIYKELEAIAMEDDTLRNAFEHWEALSGTKEEVAAYRARMKRLFDEESMIGEAEMRGREQGVREGIEQGKEEGIEIGKTKALVDTVLQQLAVKFEEIPQDIKESIVKADSRILNQLVVNIFNIEEIEDVRKYFQ